MNKDKLTLKTNLLREIFELAPRKFKEGDETNNSLSRKFKISEKEIKDNLEFLFEMYLIKKSPVKDYKEERAFEWEITDKGLDYLEKKEIEKTQEKSNRVIAFTGGIIALTTIYAFIVQSVNLENYPQTYWVITPIFLILILMCLGPLVKFIVDYWKAEVFEK